MADETPIKPSAAETAEAGLADEMAFSLRYAMPQYNGKPEAAAEAAGLPKEKGMELLQRPSVLSSIKAIRKAYGAAMPDEVEAMKGLLNIAKNGAKDADRIKAWTAYGELYAQTVRGRAKEGDEKPLGTVNNIQQNNYYSLDAAEELVRAGKLSPEDAAKIGCRQIADVEKVTARLNGNAVPKHVNEAFKAITVPALAPVLALKKDGTPKKKAGRKKIFTDEELREHRRELERNRADVIYDRKRAKILAARQKEAEKLKASLGDV